MPEHSHLILQTKNNSAAVSSELLTVQKLGQENIYQERIERLPIQKKLSIGAVVDPMEHEDHNIADKGMGIPEASFIQRKCAECEEEEKINLKPLNSFIQNKYTNNSNSTSDQVALEIESKNGGGNSISPVTRRFMETRFDTDFSDVNIHTGDYAVQLSNQLNAQAFTVGKDIYFNTGKYSPDSTEGKHLLAHELTHTIQQINRKELRKKPPALFGPATAGIGASWEDEVKAATDSTKKTALIQKALGTSVKVVDQTASSNSDNVPTPSHLSAYSDSSKIVNFDENLQLKSAAAGGRALSNNAGYTLQSGGKYYIILSPASLDSDNLYATVITLNHEFDHISQFLAGSSLKGNDSELEAWTSTFVREFHKDYVIGDTGSICFVKFINLFSPLLMYYKIVSDAKLKTSTEQTIEQYFKTVINPHPAHLLIFRYWLYKSLKSPNNPDLAIQLNTNLKLNINATDPIKSLKQFNCTGLNTLTFPSAPSVIPPGVPAGNTGTTSPKKIDE